jgi:hypothetical protein
MPSAQPTFFSIPDTQKLALSTLSSVPVQSLRISGTNATVASPIVSSFLITLTAGSSAQAQALLLNPSVALQVRDLALLHPSPSTGSLSYSRALPLKLACSPRLHPSAFLFFHYHFCTHIPLSLPFLFPLIDSIDDYLCSLKASPLSLIFFHCVLYYIVLSSCTFSYTFFIRTGLSVVDQLISGQDWHCHHPNPFK